MIPLKARKQTVNIALVGKYVELKDAYYSVREALQHAAIFHNRQVNVIWVQAEDLEKGDPDQYLRNAQGIVVPGGFGNRGIEGMIVAAKYAREHKIPYLGLCLGMQVMVIEFARHVFKSNNPNSTEFNEKTDYPVIDLMLEQRGIVDKGKTMRLGNYPCNLLDGSRACSAYGCEKVDERHRHRYEFNNKFKKQLEAAGLVCSGMSPSGQLVEVCEITPLQALSGKVPLHLTRCCWRQMRRPQGDS